LDHLPKSWSIDKGSRGRGFKARPVATLWLLKVWAKLHKNDSLLTI
jgi:hypothetical protein